MGGMCPAGSRGVGGSREPTGVLGGRDGTDEGQGRFSEPLGLADRAAGLAGPAAAVAASVRTAALRRMNMDRLCQTGLERH